MDKISNIFNLLLFCSINLFDDYWRMIEFPVGEIPKAETQNRHEENDRRENNFLFVRYQPNLQFVHKFK